MRRGTIAAIEFARTFQNNIDIMRGMRNLRWVALMGNRDFAMSNINPVVTTGYRAGGAAMNRIKFIEVRGYISRPRRIDQHNFHVITLQFLQCPHGQASDPAESADCQS